MAYAHRHRKEAARFAMTMWEQEEDATKGDGGNRAETVCTALVTALVAAGVYLYVLLRIEPRLIYEGFGVISEYPVFAADSEFALRHLAQPGGLLRYTAAFLSHSLHIAWLGALVFTAGLATLQATAGKQIEAWRQGR